MNARYYVIETRGYVIQISQHTAACSNHEGASYAVLDRIWNHREVDIFIPKQHEGCPNSTVARRRAHELCDRLNAKAEAA